MQLFNLPSLAWSATASFSQPLYTGGRLSANLVRARASYGESVANYRQQVLVAFHEVEDGFPVCASSSSRQPPMTRR